MQKFVEEFNKQGKQHNIQAELVPGGSGYLFNIKMIKVK